MYGLSQLQQIAVAAVPILFAITVHEVAHGYVADRMGDHTAREQGRLTLNPLAHIDPVGTVIVPADHDGDYRVCFRLGQARSRDRGQSPRSQAGHGLGGPCRSRGQPVDGAALGLVGRLA